MDHCHAVRVRLTEPVDLAGITRVWREPVPAAADEPLAIRRRQAELHRPVTADPGVRAVLLTYSDHRADLILVAHRAAFDQASLFKLVHREPPCSDIAEWDSDHGAERPDWGLGDPARGDEIGTHELPIDTGDESLWSTALDSVLARYGEGDAVGLLTRPEATEQFEYLPWRTPPFPLTLSLSPSTLRCTYRLDTFAPTIAEQFCRHLVRVHRLIRGAQPTTDLLDPGERARVIADGDGGALPEPAHTSLSSAFTAQATAHPDSIAVSDGEHRLTYGELDRRCTRLAQGLRALGVRTGDRVGVCLPRSVDLVALLVAVVRAGAVSVPLDPRHPADRLAYLAEDAAVTIIVTPLEDPPVSGVPAVHPDELDKLGTDTPMDPPAAGAGYVIYTSGSTGRPKGVLVPQHNVLSLVDATRADYDLGPRDVWTLFHSCSFDFSVWELWGCLLTGGHLVIVPHWVARAPERFHRLLREHHVTVLSQTPSAFRQLCDIDRDHRPELAVRLVVFGGEPLDPSDLLPWFDRYPESRCRMVNMFGITETTVHVTALTVDRGDALRRSRSVGRALPGWQVYVLDADGDLAPTGVPGEIHVAGVGVALGYLNRPGLTADRFRPDPFRGGRMYRSGDKGRMLPDGTLEHLGRLDSQVKIRGFRIEPDEIREVLREEPGVRAAAVVVRRADPDDAATARIDAYVVLDTATVADVRHRATRVLPEYMRPATITAVAAFPLTLNGKLDVDRLAAPAVEPVRQDGACGLLDIWRDVLGVPVAEDDDFFELGGNSLLAVRLAARMRERGWPRFDLRELYRRPTARLLGEALGSQGEPSEVDG
ncbi:non-ribosomal peptide synthetase [Actinokineospora enzanensis]|uniref:non-ribosomal peptide synthetase n=1 Tax=Actinokineospora enzanensis TaxID=155975 RepID=UPI001FDF7093|nr:non-ribosomal peptide synthetase [Actinokineospora enzanensis]